MVLLSETVPLRYGEITREELISGIAKWAKVTVSDGERTEVLTGGADSRYFPPYVFTTSKIVGEPGKTYTLRAEYKDYVATATTTIPKPVEPDEVYCRALGDTTYTVVVRFTDPPEKGNYYRAFTKTIGKDGRYQPSMAAYASDEVFDGSAEMILFSTQRLLEPLYMLDFKQGDEVWVKFCTMDKATFNFWSNYEVMLATNANGSWWFDTDMEVNVHGALGYWAGYGVSERKVVIGEQVNP